MKFDYFVTHTRSDASKPYEQLYADGLEQIRLCDEMGIDTIWFPEHQFTNQLARRPPSSTSSMPPIARAASGSAPRW